MMNRTIRIILAAILAAIVAFPILYAFSMSFFSIIDFTDSYAHFLPSTLSLRNYVLALSHRNFPRYIFNSVMISTLLSVLRIMITIPAAFAFSHLEFKGRKMLLGVMISTLFIPSDALLYENYSTVAALGLLDTYAAIILPSIFSASSLLMLYGAFSSGSRYVYDAARIDGSGDIRYMAEILTPLSGPFITTILMQSFITSFNSYLWPLIVTSRDSMRTVQIGLAMLGFAEEGERGAEFAAVMIITIPFLVLLAAGRRTIMKALVNPKED